MTQVRKTLIPQYGNQVLTGQPEPFTRIWYDFLITLWERTGGAVDRFAENTPTGVITAFGGSNAPNGWLSCDGSAVSRTAQAILFSVIGVTYGVGDGSTTFNLPDFRSRMILGAGQGASLSLRSLGDTGGFENITLAITNLPSHTHTPTDGGHTHTVTDPGHAHGITDPGHDHDAVNGSFIVSGGAATYTAGAVGSPESSTQSNTTGITINSATTGVTNDSATTGITIGDTGSGTSKDIMNPFGVANYIIKT